MKIDKNLVFLLLILLLDIAASALAIPIITQKFAIKDLGSDSSLKNFLLEANFSMLLSSSYIFFSPFIGFLSDIIGRKKIICYCLIFACTGYCLILIGIFMSWLILLLSGLIILGIGGALLPISLASLSDCTTGRLRLYSYAIVSGIILLFMQSTDIINYFQIKINILCLIFTALVFEVSALFIAIKLLTETYSVPNYFSNFSFIKLIKSSVKLIGNNSFLILLGLFIIFDFSWGNLEKDFTNYANFNTYLIYIYRGTMIGSALILLPFLSRSKKSSPLVSSALMVAGIALIGFTFFSKYPLLLLIISILLAGCIGLLIPTFWWLFSNLATKKHSGLVMSIICPLWCLSWSLSGIGFITNLEIHKIPIDWHLLCSGVLLLLVSMVNALSTTLRTDPSLSRQIIIQRKPQ